MQKLIIVRSFSKTKQIASFEPINSFCSVSAEYDDERAMEDQFVRSVSEHLDTLVRQEVERTIEKEMAKVEAIKNKNKF
jgi:hypothetical protein